jgi:Rhs element Vgr protein
MDETLATNNNFFPANYSHIYFSLAGQTYSVHALDGIEELGQPFCFTLDLLTYFNLPTLLSFSNKPAKLTLLADDGRERVIVGVVTHIQQLGAYKDGQHYFRFRLESRLALLKKSLGPRLFINKSIAEIITAILLEEGYEQNEMIWRLTSPLSSRPQTMQLPNESSFDFIQRLLAKEGVFHYHDSRSEREIVHFVANNQSLTYFGEIAYIKASHFTVPAKPVFYSLKAHYHLTPAVFVVSNFNLQTPGHVLQTNSMTNAKLANDQTGISYHFGDSAPTQIDAEKQASLQAEYARMQSFYLSGSGNLATLAVGQKISLDATAFNPIYSHDYLVTKLVHNAQQSAGQHGEGSAVAYQHVCTLLPAQTPFRCPAPKPKAISSLFTAHIYSPFDSEYPFLDEQGRYCLQYHFDQIAQTTPPIARLTPHTGKTTSKGDYSGLHTPINAGAEVLVSACFDDPDQPCILGTLPHAKTKSPVTAENNWHHWFKIPAQNQFLIADGSTQAQIKLANKDDQNQLCLSKNEIKLASQKGVINLTASDDINFMSGRDTLEISQANYSQHIGQSYSLSIGNDCYHHAAHHQFVRAKQALHLNASRQCLFNSGQSLTINALDNITIDVSGDRCSFNVDSGNFSLACGDDIVLRGTGEGSIEIGQLGAGITLKSDGSMVIFGEQVNLIGETAIIVKK